jgi:hypothetical protein
MKVDTTSARRSSQAVADLVTGGGSDGSTQAAVALGVARAGFGAAMLLAPALLPRLLGADRLTARRVGHLGRMVGVRELALGVGTLRATRTGDDVPTWVAAQALSDAGDALSVLAGLRRRHVARVTGWLVVLAGVGGAIGDVLVIRRLRAPR